MFDRAALTLNCSDFIDLHHVVPGHAGIVVCDADADYYGLAERIDAAIDAIPSLAGQLIEVTNP